MAESRAVLLSELQGTKATDDGEHVLLGFNGPKGEIALALPHDLCPNIIASLSHAYGEIQIKRGERGGKVPGNNYAAQAFPVEWFEIGAVAQGKILLSLTIEGGPKLHFHLPGGMAEQIQETLAATFSKSLNSEKPSSVN